MHNEDKTSENTTSDQEVIEIVDIDSLDIRRFSRWIDKDKRLFVVLGFWYGPDLTKPHLGLFQKSDIDLLDVNTETSLQIPIRRFERYVIDRLLMPWTSNS